MLPLRIILLSGLTLLTLLRCRIVGATPTDDEDAPGWTQADFSTFFVPDANTQAVYLPLRDNMTQWIWMDAAYDAQKIERIVFTIHGLGRDVFNYARHNQRAREAAVAGNASGGARLDPTTVLLMAPQFFNHGDHLTSTVPDPDPHHQPCYSGKEWAWAMPSMCEDKSMTSFEAMDLLTAWMTDRARFPRLNTIVINGHSLGGFFAHRYAMIGRPAQRDGVEYHFWVANPATYLYLDPYRPVETHVMDKCPTYDTWPWGLTGDFNTTYWDGQLPSAARLWATYSSRFVHHAQGLKDTHHSERGCEMQTVQAPSHLERCFTWMARVMNIHGGLPANGTIDYLPDVSHDAALMMTHPVSLFRLFYENHSKNLTLPSQLEEVSDASNGYASQLQWHAPDDEREKYDAAQATAKAIEAQRDARKGDRPEQGATGTGDSTKTSTQAALTSGAVRSRCTTQFLSKAASLVRNVLLRSDTLRTGS